MAVVGNGSGSDSIQRGTRSSGRVVAARPLVRHSVLCRAQQTVAEAPPCSGPWGLCCSSSGPSGGTPGGFVIYTGMSGSTGSAESSGQVTGWLAPQPGPAVDPAPQPAEIPDK